MYENIGVVEFKSEENMKKAVEVMDKQSFSGRPLKVKEDLDGEHARRMMQKFGGFDRMGMGGGGGVGGPGMNIPPALLHNSHVPRDVLNALQAGRLGSTIFIVNSVMSSSYVALAEPKLGVAEHVLLHGNVLYQNIVNAYLKHLEFLNVCLAMFNGQLLYDRPMHIKM
eukprot:g40814.t1